MKKKEISPLTLLFSIVMLLLGVVLVLGVQLMSGQTDSIFQKIGFAFIVSGIVTLFQETVTARSHQDKIIVVDFPNPLDKNLLRQWWHEVLRDRGHHICYAMFLVLPSDKEVFRYLTEYGRELDLISGEECLVIALGKTEFRRSGFEDEIWGSAVKEHFSEGLCIRVSKLFDIDFTRFPCLLLFQDIRSTNHIVVEIKDLTAEEIADKLRAIFSVIRKAASEKEDPLVALEHQRNNEVLHKGRKTIVSAIQSFTGKTFETAVEAWINATIK